jgi:hypothetical protein
MLSRQDNLDNLGESHMLSLNLYNCLKDVLETVRAARWKSDSKSFADLGPCDVCGETVDRTDCENLGSVLDETSLCKILNEAECDKAIDRLVIEGWGSICSNLMGHL